MSAFSKLLDYVINLGAPGERDDSFARSLEKKVDGKPYLRFFKPNFYVDVKRQEKIIRLLEDYTESNGFSKGEVNILDIGCNIGSVALSLASLGYHVTGVDLDEAAIDCAKERSEALDNIEFVCGYAESYLSEKEYNVVLALDVLEHMIEPDLICHSIYRSLTSPGVFIVSVPNCWGCLELSFTPSEKIIRRLMGIKAPEGSEHIQRFTLGRLRKTMGNIGFQYQFVASLDFILIFSVLKRASLAPIDQKVADLVPKFMANRWLVIGRKPAN